MEKQSTEKKLNKFFDFKEAEKKHYANWLEKGYFKPDMASQNEAFSIVMPPPNITGQLHMGHALDLSYPDILVRMKRMQGYKVLWLPGTDHASIATEAKIVEAMKKEGLTKQQIGRTEFLKRAWQWKEEYSQRIVSQIKRLGASADWSRQRFTMDEGLSKSVRHVFCDLYNKGLIYRGKRLINWCSNCATTISDAEIEYENEESSLWHLRYPVLPANTPAYQEFAKDSLPYEVDENKQPKDFLVLATTRPETLFGDTAVAVNPKDERYQHLIGKQVLLPLKNKAIPVIGDEYVDMEFGTGVVKITPAHDFNDYEVGKRHNLPTINVFEENGTLNQEALEFQGLTLKEARKLVVKELEAKHLLAEIKKHNHNVGTCYRCQTRIEPRLSEQWFVKMEELARPAIEVVRQKEISFIPERFDKIYFNWMENIKDWCISRQLWWGHRIPAYYNDRTGEIFVSTEEMTVDPKTGENLRQDEDTLDTWFSSALWPFSTMNWLENGEDYQTFYPTSVMVTGYDIIFFWVARMIFSGLYQTGKIPFKDVIIHGIVRDEQGRKMSKSLGNGIDPLEILDEYGADALRYALIDSVSTGNDMRLQKEKLEAAGAFINKVWNAYKFVVNFLDTLPADCQLEEATIDENNFALEDKYILAKFQLALKTFTRNMESYEFGVALSNFVEFIWEDFCDWYIEMVKPRLYDENAKGRTEALYMLNEILKQSMQVLHPFMPFLTEEVYLGLKNVKESIMISKWPSIDESKIDLEAIKNMQELIDVIKQVRALRLKMQVKNSQKTPLFIRSTDEMINQFFLNALPYLEKLANISEVKLGNEEEFDSNKCISGVFGRGSFAIPLENLVDLKQEKERLQKEIDKLDDEINRVLHKLNNAEFVNKAPAKVVNIEQEKLEKYTRMKQTLAEQLANL